MGIDGKERFFATLAREQVDRPAWWLGEPTEQALPGLLRHFDARDEAGLKAVLDDDVANINVPYSSPAGNHIACSLNFSKNASKGYEERTLTDPGYFEDMDDPEAVDGFPWPDPSLYIDREEARGRAMAAPADKARMGLVWSCHFQDACSAFGMESALVAMLSAPEMFQAVIDRITEFYLQANAVFYEATRGYMDAVLMGNDFGCQTNLLLSPDLLRKHVFPGTKRLVDQAHSYGLKVIHHSCGSVHEVIMDIVATGADAVHPIQALAANMDAATLRKDFGGRASFCGGVDAQQLLVNGTPEQVEEEVWRLRDLFPTGLIVSPSHEAILVDIPPQNIAALARAAGATRATP
ncbi:MAG: hypothetical protein LUC93_08245 [Planctomycetaceae bacterium]|nr:hypothetical protein [Planctomycetaceae bacterium]